MSVLFWNLMTSGSGTTPAVSSNPRASTLDATGHAATLEASSPSGGLDATGRASTLTSDLAE
jgi:hypothetical protein